MKFATGMLTDFTVESDVADNMANMETPGYKERTAVTETFRQALLRAQTPVDAVETGTADVQIGRLAVAPEVESYGRMTRFGSSAQLGGCGTGICIYLGAQDGTLYLVPLDARKAVISACITTSPPTCSGVNPRLWASVEVGAGGSPQTVHVEGWSYYSG